MKKYLICLLLVMWLFPSQAANKIKHELSHVPVSGSVCFNLVVFDNKIKLFCKEEI